MHRNWPALGRGWRSRTVARPECDSDEHHPDEHGHRDRAPKENAQAGACQVHEAGKETERCDRMDREDPG